MSPRPASDLGEFRGSAPEPCEDWEWEDLSTGWRGDVLIFTKHRRDGVDKSVRKGWRKGNREEYIYHSLGLESG